MVGVYKAMVSDQPYKVKSHVSFTRSNKELVASNVELLDLTQLSKDEITTFRKHVEQIEAKIATEEEIRASIDAGVPIRFDDKKLGKYRFLECCFIIFFLP